MPLTPDQVDQTGSADIDVDGALLHVSQYSDLTYDTRPIGRGRWYNFLADGESIGMVNCVDGEYLAYESLAVGVSMGHPIPDLGSGARVLLLHRHLGPTI